MQLKILHIMLLLIFVSACAKPKVVQVKSPDDKNLSCEELNFAIFESEKLKKDAKFAKSGTGGNVSRMLLFWPAWAKTFHNADVAITAANDRIYHLTVLKKKKKCSKSHNSSVITPSVTNSLANELKQLKDLFDNDVITEYEYEKAKKKLLN